MSSVWAEFQESSQFARLGMLEYQTVKYYMQALLSGKATAVF